MALPNLDALPAAIRSSSKAVIWKFEPRAGQPKPAKVPYQPHRPNERAAVNNPATWGTFAEAYDSVADGKADGVGIVLGDGVVGIDLDGCRDPQTGVLSPRALALLRAVNSYSEVSPSLTGIHILALGTLPPGRRRTDWAEFYDIGRYFTVTGEHLPETPATLEDRTAVLTDIHAEVFSRDRTTARAATSSPVTSATLGDAEILIKASTAANGARFVALWGGDCSAYDGDESAADLALCNLLAFYTVRDADQMDRLFRQSGLIRPKWDSRRGETTYGAITIARAIAGCASRYGPAIDIEITETIPDPEPAPTPASTTATWPTLHADALVGLLGDLVRAMAPATEADPVALLGHALVLWGNLIGRTPHARVGSDRHHANENLLIVGSTASARKGLALSAVRAVMRQVDPDWTKTRLVSGLSSGEGLIYFVRDPREEQEPIKEHGKVTGYQTVIQDAGVSDKRLCVEETEFGKTLRVSRREGNTISAVLRQAWDHGQLHVLTRHSPLMATGAHISVVGHITPQELRQEVGTVDLAGGLLNRFLLLVVRRSQSLPHGGSVDGDVLDALVQRFVAATAAARRTTTLARTAEAAAYWEVIYQHLTRERAGLIGAVCARAPAHVLRMSVLYALADQSPAIRLVDVKAAVALWTYAEASAQLLFKRRIGRRLADYLLAVLRDRPAGLTRTELSNALGRNRNADEIHEALQMLLDYGLARWVREPVARDGGRPVMRWFATDDGAEDRS